MSSFLNISDEELHTRSYLSKYLDVTGIKGISVMLLLLGYSAITAINPGYLSTPIPGLIAFLTIITALKADQKYNEKPLKDPVGLTIASLALLHSILTLLDIDLGLTGTTIAFASVFTAVIYHYTQGINKHNNRWIGRPKEMPEFLKIDLTGFLLTEYILIYLLLGLGGWNQFARSSTFLLMGFIIFATFFSVIAGYTVIRLEIQHPLAGEELNEAIISLVSDIQRIDDEAVKQDLATKLRLISKNLDGAKLPTNVKDIHGYIPLILLANNPDTSYTVGDIGELISNLESDGATGYLIHGVDDVYLFKQGRLETCYVDGEYRDNPGESENRSNQAGFHSLTHGTLENLLDVVGEETDEEEKEQKEETSNETEQKEGETTKKIKLGESEIDMEDLVEKADEIIEEISD